MNKYYRILDKILATGKTQTNKKGNIQYTVNRMTRKSWHNTGKKG